MNDQAYAEAAKETLEKSIALVASLKQYFLKHPETDYTRNRKITFERFLNICLQMEGGTLQNELLKYYDHALDTPTKSAFCQQREKVSPEAFEFLFWEFTKSLVSLDAPKTMKGYRLLACDGSDINIPYNPLDKDTFQQNGEKKGFNQLHLNAIYDILNGIYIDCILETDKKCHERAAFLRMVERCNDSIPSIFLADRGYEGYSVFAHLLYSGQKFLIRCKGESSNGMLSTYCFPYDDNGEFDCHINTILTCKQTKDIKENPQKFTYVPRDKFDLYEKDYPFFPLDLRVLCIKLVDGNFEYLVTNLDENDFSIAEIKDLYHLRWGIETSFRQLKYTIDLVHFHAKKRQFIEQEIWARLIVYNFCEAITRHIAVTRQAEAKYDLQVNFSTAVCTCKAFLKHENSEIQVCSLIARFLSPIRPNRAVQRNIKPSSAKPFLYRAS